MKKLNCLPKFLIFGLLIYLTVNTVKAQYVTLQGKQFKIGANNYNPMIMNYSIEAIKFYNTNTYYISAMHSFGQNNDFECNNSISCYNHQLLSDFNRMSGMGFNGMRIGFGPKYLNGIGLYFYFAKVNDSGVFSGYDSLPLNPTDTADLGMNTIFPLLDSILAIASQVPDTFKIILLAIGGNSDYTTTEVSAWNDFFNALSTHFASSIHNDELFAYDLMNEPAYSISYNNMKTKQEACEIVSTWYNTIKSNDTHHLVTLGGSGQSDIMSFDPAVIKLDFASLHFYPGFTPYEDRTDPAIQQRARERAILELYWMQQNCPIPWIIGETGFTASASYEDTLNYYEGLRGTLADQDSFARVSLKASCNCGASGYSWWLYQDVYFDTLGGIDFGGNFFGLLERGAGYPGNPIYKPAANEFMPPFTWGVTGTCPVSYSATYNADKLYYNPGMHPYNPQQGGNIITGTVTDQDGNPIKDAVIVAHTFMAAGAYDVHNTHTDENGFYKIIPYDFIPSIPELGYTIDIMISAPGAERKYSGWGIDPSLTEMNFTLEKTDFYFDTQTSGHTVASGTTKIFRGYNTLTTSDITVQNNAVAEFVAPQGVTINSDFTAELGSEVTIYCATTRPDCNEFSGYAMEKSLHYSAPGNTESDIKNTKEIEVGFALPLNSLFVFPNPSNGVFTVQFTDTLNEKQSEIKVFDIYSREVYSKPMETGYETLDLSSFSKGIYYIRIINAEKTFNKKIIFE